MSVNNTYFKRVTRACLKIILLPLVFLALLTTCYLNGASAVSRPDAIKQAHVLTLSATDNRIDFFPYLTFFEDKSAKLTFQEAEKAQYQPLKVRNLGYSNSAYWFKLRLKDTAQLERVLAYYWPVINKFDVWVSNARGVQHFALGDHRPYRQRPIKSHFIAVPLQVNASPTDIYFRIQTNSLILILGDIWQTQDYQIEDQSSSIYSGAYIGLMLTAVLIFIVLGVILKNSLFASYAFYLLAFCAVVASVTGYLNELLPKAPALVSDYVVLVGSILFLLFDAIFIMQLMNTKQYYPRIHVAYQFKIGLALIALLCVVLPWYGHLIRAVHLVGFAYLIVPVYLSFKKLQAAHTLDNLLFLFSISLMVTSAGAYILMLMNVIDLSYVLGTIFKYSVLSTFVCMSVAMALEVRNIELGRVSALSALKYAENRAAEQRRFVAMLSHEFKNPLITIDRAAQMIQLTLAQADQEILKRLNNIRASASRLSSFVDNFLLTERMDAGFVQLNPLMHSTSVLLNEIKPHFTKSDWARVHLETEDFYFIVDLDMLSMAVCNLINNALRYAYANSIINLKITTSDQSLMVIVSDTGPGISKDEIIKLGIPYFRTNAKQGKKGTGLGYYFCKKIVEAHQGTLTAALNVLGGLDVTIKIPQHINK